MKVISIINLKGGVGKTMTALQMGHILHHRHGYRVLLVDNDKQGNLSLSLIHIWPDSFAQGVHSAANGRGAPEDGSGEYVQGTHGVCRRSF